VALGDSITDGSGSSSNTNQRWPDVLHGRLAAQSKRYESVVDEGIAGNLVLTDSALQATAEIGLLPATAVKPFKDLAGSYSFWGGPASATYNVPDQYPLARNVKKPGAAEQVVGLRQAVEPTPLGYSPDIGLDTTPEMPFWGVDKTAWEKACGRTPATLCTTATTVTNGTSTNLGEAVFGKGRVRVAGILLPDPVFVPGKENDARYGLASYALTYTGYDVFSNLVSFQRGSALGVVGPVKAPVVAGAATNRGRLPATGGGLGLAAGMALVAGAGLVTRAARRRRIKPVTTA